MSILTFEIENTNYEIPNYLTIENYIKLYQIKDVVEDEYFNLKMINQLSNAPIEKLKRANYNDIHYLSNYIMTLFPTDSKFKDTFKLDGIEYGFIPQWKKMSFAEWVDLDTLFKKKDIMNYVHILTAIMYRPITKWKGKIYEIEDYDSDEMLHRAELFKKKLDIRYYLGAQFFFSQFVKRYGNYSLRYSNMTLMKKIKYVWKMRKLMTKILLNESMDGILSSEDLLIMTSPKMKMSSKWGLWKYLTTWPTLSRWIGKKKK